MPVSTHVLDAVTGNPACDVPVRLEPSEAAAGATALGGTTDGDGRLLLRTGVPGPHRLVFDTSGYSRFFPEVIVAFTVVDPERHLHVPLLLSPYAYSVYRGS